MHETQVGNANAYPFIIFTFEGHATHVVASMEAAPLTALGHKTQRRNEGGSSHMQDIATDGYAGKGSPRRISQLYICRPLPLMVNCELCCGCDIHVLVRHGIELPKCSKIIGNLRGPSLLTQSLTKRNA